MTSSSRYLVLAKQKRKKIYLSSNTDLVRDRSWSSTVAYLTENKVSFSEVFKVTPAFKVVPVDIIN